MKSLCSSNYQITIDRSLHRFRIEIQRISFSQKSLLTYFLVAYWQLWSISTTDQPQETSLNCTLHEIVNAIELYTSIPKMLKRCASGKRQSHSHLPPIHNPYRRTLEQDQSVHLSSMTLLPATLRLSSQLSHILVTFQLPSCISKYCSGFPTSKILQTRLSLKLSKPKSHQRFPGEYISSCKLNNAYIT